MDREKIFGRLGAYRRPGPLELEPIASTTYEERLEAFLQALEGAGGEAILAANLSLVVSLVRERYRLTSIASIHPLEGVDFDPNTLAHAHELDGIECAIVQGAFGVAENGAVWIMEERNRHRALYTIVPHLVLLLSKNRLVDTMMEAYRRIDRLGGYGLFISGPSKTADIEQALVFGAHGAKRTTVVLV